jgi:hypothetical protein
VVGNDNQLPREARRAPTSVALSNSTLLNQHVKILVRVSNAERHRSILLQGESFSPATHLARRRSMRPSSSACTSGVFAPGRIPSTDRRRPLTPCSRIESASSCCRTRLSSRRELRKPSLEVRPTAKSQSAAQIAAWAAADQWSPAACCRATRSATRRTAASGSGGHRNTGETALPLARRACSQGANDRLASVVSNANVSRRCDSSSRRASVRRPVAIATVSGRGHPAQMCHVLRHRRRTGPHR